MHDNSFINNNKRLRRGMVKYTMALDCPECEGSTLDGLSECCGSGFHEPGYPDNDICAGCGEHSQPWECSHCKGEGIISKEVDLPKIIEDELKTKDGE